MTPELVAAVDSAVKQRHARQASRDEIAFTCPKPEGHANRDAHPSARWNRTKAVWHCDVCGAAGGIIALARRLRLPLPERLGHVSRKETGRWTIRDGTGRPVAVKVRLEPGRNGRRKDYVWFHPDGRTPGATGRRALRHGLIQWTGGTLER